MKPHPIATVGALIRNPHGQILLVQSHKWRYKYSVPGGHIEHRELVTHAVQREAQEEVGLHIKVLKPLLIQDAVYPRDFIHPQHFIFLDYLCTTRSTTVRIDRKEIQHAQWVTPQEALALDLEEYTRNLIRHYLKEIKPRASRARPPKS